MQDDFSARAFRYRQHHAKLTVLYREVASQARYRPRLKVPVETMRIVRRHLLGVRKFRAACGAKARRFPTVPGGTLRFSTLSMLLAMTRAEFESFGRAFQYHVDPEPPMRRSGRPEKTETPKFD